METRANYALIGAFTLAVVAAAFLFVFWFSGNDRSGGRVGYRIVFEGSVSGMSRGSAVTFNGIRIGEVTDVSLMPDDPRKVVARVDIDRNVPVRADTRARLEYQGLTGVAQVALTGGAAGAPPLEPPPGSSLPQIAAERSDFQDLIETARNIARRADEVLTRVDGVVAGNAEGVNRTIQNVERFSKALSDNAPGMDRFLAQVGQAAERIGPLAERLETLSTNVNRVVEAVEPARVAKVIDNVEGFTRALADNRDNVTTVLTSAAQLTQRLNETSVRLDTTLADVSTLVKAVDAGAINKTIANVQDFSKTLADNRGNVNQILGDVAVLSRRLTDTTTRIDAALAEVSGVVKAIDPTKLASTLTNVEGFSQTLAANRESLTRLLDQAGKLATAIDGDRINRVLANTERFTQALGESSGDAERTVKNAASLTDKLNRSADRLDGVLKAAEGFLGSASGAGGEGMFQDIREAAKSVRVLADNLDKRTAEITAGINRVTGPALREFEALATDGRRTLNDLSRTARSLERNPQQVIFGGKASVPEYNGRR
ncbi:MlaD family protein [Salinarimonas soli]|uniref:MCE family protein n=1 Tax=Salinarimonas soli TaxID=1638099 RepID=A0A5B2VEM6_9HYPH|nr:MlaD family protein [Salinarimonas soli]KAA2237275.1 MCE family protein [Salinarimonas soli]